MNVSTVVRHDLDSVIMTRYIRVHPGYFGQVNYICIRLELYGCVPEFKKGSFVFLSIQPLPRISRIILVYYCKCCNLIGYSTRYLFIIR